MSNYENIKPYSDLAHKASANGGPELFLRKHAETNRRLGVQAEKETEGWKAAVLSIVVLSVWEGAVKPAWHWAINRYTQKKEQAQLEAMAAEAELLRSMKEASQSEINNVSS